VTCSFYRGAEPIPVKSRSITILSRFEGRNRFFKNPPSYRQLDYANPTEASEVVLLADLLMRLLDRTLLVRIKKLVTPMAIDIAGVFLYT
jgi:hypothetical protein